VACLCWSAGSLGYGHMVRSVSVAQKMAGPNFSQVLTGPY
jgi:hypothetical protein